MTQSPEIIQFQFCCSHDVILIRAASDGQGPWLLLFNFYGAHKNFPKRHRNCQRHQILLVLLFVWSGKGPNQRGLSVYVYLLLCCTRRFSSGARSVGKYGAICERKDKLLGKVKQSESNTALRLFVFRLILSCTLRMRILNRLHSYKLLYKVLNY
jgi:hypothetical protein